MWACPLLMLSAEEDIHQGSSVGPWGFLEDGLSQTQGTPHPCPPCSVLGAWTCLVSQPLTWIGLSQSGH